MRILINVIRLRRKMSLQYYGVVFKGVILRLDRYALCLGKFDGRASDTGANDQGMDSQMK